LFGIFVVLGFAPLLHGGLLRDLIRGLGVTAYNGPYSKVSLAGHIAFFIEEIREPKNVALLISSIILTMYSRSTSLRSMAGTWLLAVVGALCYRPLHPVDHGYLRTPLALTSAVAWAIPAAWIIKRTTEGGRLGPRPFLGVLVILFIVYETIPRLSPWNCNLRASLDAIRAAGRGDWPDLPPGGWIWYSPEKQSNYTWDDYCRLLRYVRQATGPETIVANVLKNPPFPSVNGPTGRRSPFHVESGIAWMWLIDEDLDAQFAHELQEAGFDSIVVWSREEIDSQPRLPLKRLTKVILTEYMPEARFGQVEVWRRKRKTPEVAPASLKGR
jgi:hypothetical protein